MFTNAKWLILGSFVFIALAIVPAESFPGSALIAAKAMEMATPLTETSMARLHNTLLGSGRASRSSDIVIFNKTDRTFRLKKNSCKWGGWSKQMLPEHIIPPMSSVVYGAESQGFMTGYSDCKVEYKSKSKDGTSVYVELTSSNPYWSPNTAGGYGSGVEVFTIMGKGMNNHIQFIIEEANQK